MPHSINHAIIGTAGHIDHGKTALVKALTGIDVDTLAEEKRRGITIELGFAFMDTPGFEKQIVFIDVPGHEKLIKTMVAGAANLDAALLVVAADEGVSVQTREHFDILRVLGITRGVIAITKSDLVDSERADAVTEEVRGLVAGSFLDSAPTIPVSAVTGEGIDELRAALVEAAGGVGLRRRGGAFRMPIDRVFTMHGFGTVIAGTILSGEVEVGDRLVILPDGLKTRVRGIQVQARSAKSSSVGTRTAVNLQDLKKDQLRRGQTAVAPGSITSTDRIDARLRVLSTFDGDLKSRMRVRLHIGADEVMARLLLLDRDSLGPGDEALVQLVLESHTVALPRDRYVIRTFSSLVTIGGGEILDSQAAPHRRHDPAVLQSLAAREGGAEDVIEQVFDKSGAQPLTIAAAAAVVGESEETVRAVAEVLHSRGRLVRIGAESYLHPKHYDQLADRLLSILNDYYKNNPYRYYMPVSDLQSRFAKVATRDVCEAITTDLLQRRVLELYENRIGLVERSIGWKPGERQTAERVLSIYEEAGFAAPPEDEVARDLNIASAWFANIMIALLDSGDLVRVGARVTYSRSTIAAARSLVVDHIRKHGAITAGELRDQLGLSRKYAISILEYLDSIRVTRRLEDKRVLR